MQIVSLELENFMAFNQLKVDFSPNINIICGENSTGKTALIKLIYSCTKGCIDANNAKGELTKEKVESIIVSKLQGVFRPDNDSVGRLVKRKQGSSRTEVNIKYGTESNLHIGFSNRAEKHVDIDGVGLSILASSNAVYIPPKEIISSTENFGALYSEYHIAFEETYYDLARLLERPLKKGAKTAEQNQVLKDFAGIVNGSVVQKDKKFYLRVEGSGEFEMGLVSEGYRKLGTIMYLILSGSLSKNAVLFWDEPETNMNPKMIKPMVDAIIELAKLGVQVFVTTHDYFVQQCFSMASRYPQNTKKNLKYAFMSLYRTENGVEAECADSLAGLNHNAVMEEFDALYDREQELIYGNT